LVDIGLVVLARPVTGIAPATLAAVGDLSSALGARMTFVGYGCESYGQPVRNFGNSTVAQISEQAVWYSPDPAKTCEGDSGGPTFYQDQVATVMSDGDGILSYRFRVDRPVVLDWIKGVIASLSPTPDLNQHGLTGSWYEPATSGQGLEVEIFPNLAGPGNAVLQVSWFTFDAVAGGSERQRWYTLAGNAASGAASATLAMYENVGGNFNAPPVTDATQVGSATLSFSSCDQGTLDYTFTDGSGRSGRIELTRLTKKVTCASGGAPLVNADFAFSGNWYDPATSGQGITVEINPLNAIAFLAWYTYAPNGAAAGAAGQRWYTGESDYTAGARTVSMTLYETTGGQFDAPSTPPPSTLAVGTATLAFQSCTDATLQYQFTGGSSAGASDTIKLQRLGPAPPGCAI
jgi:hypothetical protein